MREPKKPEKRTTPKIGAVSMAAMEHSLARLHLRQLRTWVTEIHEMLSQHLRAFERDADASAAQVDSESREEWYDRNSDKHWELSEMFPQLLRRSVLVTSCTFLGHTLVRLCTHFAYQRPHGVSIGDLRGDGIDRARAYLSKVQGLSFTGSEWQRPLAYRMIRNVLVHNNAKLPPDGRGTAIQQFLDRNRGLGKVDEYGSLSLEEKACEDCLDSIDRLLAHVFAAAQTTAATEVRPT